MIDLPEFNPECPGCQALLKIIQQQQEIINKQQQLIDQLTERVEKLEREGKRQAAPFRKPTKLAPKKPGRKPGPQHGEHQRRVEPAKIDEVYDVPLPKECTQCGGNDITPCATATQYQVDIPRQVIHRQFNIAVGCCADCSTRIQGRHELQTSNALGAAKVQLGPNLHAAIALLNKELGLSHGKVQCLIKMLFSIHIGRSTSCRSMQRTGAKLAIHHEKIAQAVRGSPQVVADETGWRVGGQSSWLHVFVGLNETYYTIDPSRSGEPARTLLGKDWAGTLIHDGWSVYDTFKEANHQQCLAHLLRRCSELIDVAAGRAWGQFPLQIKQLLLQALEYRDHYRSHRITPHGLSIVAGQLSSKIGTLIAYTKRHAGNQKLAKFLRKHSGELFTFLKHPKCDATNWRAEQAIRPAVVNRKVWGGNRTLAGATAQSIIMSVFRTCQNRNHDAYPFIHQQLTSLAPIPLPSTP